MKETVTRFEAAIKQKEVSISDSTGALGCAAAGTLTGACMEATWVPFISQVWPGR